MILGKRPIILALDYEQKLLSIIEYTSRNLIMLAQVEYSPKKEVESRFIDWKIFEDLASKTNFVYIMEKEMTHKIEIRDTSEL